MGGVSCRGSPCIFGAGPSRSLSRCSCCLSPAARPSACCTCRRGGTSRVVVIAVPGCSRRVGSGIGLGPCSPAGPSCRKVVACRASGCCFGSSESRERIRRIWGIPGMAPEGELPYFCWVAHRCSTGPSSSAGASCSVVGTSYSRTASGKDSRVCWADCPQNLHPP